VGDKKIEILDKCGEPLSRDIVGVETHFTDGWTKKKAALEEWTYKFNRDYYSVLTFRGSELITIETIWKR